MCVYPDAAPHVLVQAQYTNGETRWTGKGCLECQNHEVSDTKHPFFVIYIWTDHCNPFNWSPTHSTGPQSIQLVPKFQYWLIQCQNGQFWPNKLILSFHCAPPQPSQVVPGSFNWSVMTQDDYISWKNWIPMSGGCATAQARKDRCACTHTRGLDGWWGSPY